MNGHKDEKGKSKLINVVWITRTLCWTLN